MLKWLTDPEKFDVVRVQEFGGRGNISPPHTTMTLKEMSLSEDPYIRIQYQRIRMQVLRLWDTLTKLEP